MPDHLQCPYCLDAPDEADLPDHLWAHRAADVGGMLLAVETIVAYQEVAIALLRGLRRQWQGNQAMAWLLTVALLRAGQAEDRADRWERAACYFWRSR